MALLRPETRSLVCLHGSHSPSRQTNTRHPGRYVERQRIAHVAARMWYRSQTTSSESKTRLREPISRSRMPPAQTARRMDEQYGEQLVRRVVRDICSIGSMYSYGRLLRSVWSSMVCKTH